MMARTLRGCAITTLALALVSCGDRRENERHHPSPEEPIIVASTRLGVITSQDLDRLAGRLGTLDRPDFQQTPAERYRELARRLAIEELILVGDANDEVSQGDGNGNGNGDGDLDLRHRVFAYSQHHLASLDPPPAITEADLRAAFDARRDRFRREETRRVRHIFLRYPEDGDPVATWRRIEALRQQILDGLPFERAARELSESETRHHDGLLGFVARGTFPPDFDRVVFALEAEVPSEPVSTAEGAHLFYVSNVLETHDPTFEEIRQILGQALHIEREAERLRAAAEAMPMPDDTLAVDPARLHALLATGADKQEVLRVGRFRLTVGVLREQLLLLSRSLGDLADTPLAGASLAEQLLTDWRDRAIIYSAMRSREEAGEHFDLPTERILASQRQQRIERRLAARMRDHVARDTERIERHHAAHRMRFATPLRLEIDRLTVPIGDAAGRTMARLEAARKALDEGETTLVALAENLAGDVKRSGPLTIAALARLDPPAVRFASLLQPGEHAPPYRSGDALALFTVVSRSEPQPLPLETVREQVIDDILAQNGPELFHEVSESLLAEASFRIDEGAIERLIATP